MIKKYKAVFLLLVALGVVGIITLYLRSVDASVLSPMGIIAQEQYRLLVIGALLSLIVVLPVFALTFFIVWRYRAGNIKAKYNPDWDKSRIAETIWWTVPIVLICILSGIIWSSSHKLDPFKPLTSDKKPITIQVVALQWKWLFIYPEQDIATVNYVQFPEDTPVNFVLTSDAPMNSFWIPQLGGQIYAMSGMSTKLHLMADQPGEYQGSSANISGEGFAGMKFKARASTQADFEAWALSTKASSKYLSLEEYDVLAKPSQNNPEATYSGTVKNLYDTVVMKYMTPGMQHNTSSNTASDHEHTR